MPSFSHYTLVKQLHATILANKQQLDDQLNNKIYSKDASMTPEKRKELQALGRFLDALPKEYLANDNAKFLNYLLEVATHFSNPTIAIATLDNKSPNQIVQEIKDSPYYQLTRQELMIERQIDYINAKQFANSAELLKQRQHILNELKDINYIIAHLPEEVNFEFTASYRGLQQRVSALEVFANTLMIEQLEATDAEDVAELNHNLKNTATHLKDALANAKTKISEVVKNAEAEHKIAIATAAEIADPTDGIYVTLINKPKQKISEDAAPYLKIFFGIQKKNATVKDSLTNFHQHILQKDKPISLFQYELFERLMDFSAGRINHVLLSEKLKNLAVRYPHAEHQALLEALAIQISNGVSTSFWQKIKSFFTPALPQAPTSASTSWLKKIGNSIKNFFTPTPATLKPVKEYAKLWPWQKRYAYTAEALPEENKTLKAIDTAIQNAPITSTWIVNSIQKSLQKLELDELSKPQKYILNGTTVDKYKKYADLVQRFQENLANLNVLVNVTDPRTIVANDAKKLLDEHLIIAKEFASLGYEGKVADYYSAAAGSALAAASADASSTPATAATIDAAPKHLERILEILSTATIDTTGIKQHIQSTLKANGMASTQDTSHATHGRNPIDEFAVALKALTEEIRQQQIQTTTIARVKATATEASKYATGKDAEGKQILHHIEQNVELFYIHSNDNDNAAGLVRDTDEQQAIIQTYIRLACKFDPKTALDALDMVLIDSDKVTFTPLIDTQRQVLKVLLDNFDDPRWEQLINSKDFGTTYENLLTTIQNDRLLLTLTGTTTDSSKADTNPILDNLNVCIINNIADTAAKATDPTAILTIHLDEFSKVLSDETRTPLAATHAKTIIKKLPQFIAQKINMADPTIQALAIKVKAEYKLTDSIPVDAYLISRFIMLEAIKAFKNNRAFAGAIGMSIMPAFLVEQQEAIEESVYMYIRAKTSSSATSKAPLGAYAATISSAAAAGAALSAASASSAAALGGAMTSPDKLATGGAASSSASSSSTTDLTLS